MPTRNVNLTPELDSFIATKVEGGLYANASEVMRTALRLLRTRTAGPCPSLELSRVAGGHVAHRGKEGSLLGR